MCHSQLQKQSNGLSPAATHFILKRNSIVDWFPASVIPLMKIEASITSPPCKLLPRRSNEPVWKKSRLQFPLQLSGKKSALIFFPSDNFPINCLQHCHKTGSPWKLSGDFRMENFKKKKIRNCKNSSQSCHFQPVTHALKEKNRPLLRCCHMWRVFCQTLFRQTSAILFFPAAIALREADKNWSQSPQCNARVLG